MHEHHHRPLALIVSTVTTLLVLGVAFAEAALIAYGVGRNWGITFAQACVLAVPVVACAVPGLSNLYALVLDRTGGWPRRCGHATRALGVLLMLAGVLPAAAALEARDWAIPSAAAIAAGYALVLVSVPLLALKPAS